MSKASEWAAQMTARRNAEEAARSIAAASAKRRPEFTVQGHRFATVSEDCQFVWQAPVGVNALETKDATRLAHWILETFGDAPSE